MSHCSIPEAMPSVSRQRYGIIPTNMNSWERAFADFLDRDGSGTVLWWHRNPSLKPWSVRVLLADGRGLFPDFIVGIKDRPKEDGVLLTDTKYAFELHKEIPKILAEHATYGRVLLLHRTGDNQWAVVQFHAGSGRATLGNNLRIADAAGYGWLFAEYFEFVRFEHTVFALFTTFHVAVCAGRDGGSGAGRVPVTRFNGSWRPESSGNDRDPPTSSG
jgi:hypothetical protein